MREADAAPPLSIRPKDTLICQYTDCDNVASDLDMVEKRIIDSLREWLKEYRLSWETGDIDKDHAFDVQRKGLKKAQGEISTLEKQRDSLHDLRGARESMIRTPSWPGARPLLPGFNRHIPTKPPLPPA